MQTILDFFLPFPPGLNPRPTEAQTKAWDTLASHMSLRSFNSPNKKNSVDDDEDEEEDSFEIDVFSSKHCILHDSRILKRSIFQIHKLLIIIEYNFTNIYYYTRS
jgi:hypothetical protein